MIDSVPLLFFGYFDVEMGNHIFFSIWDEKAGDGEQQ